MEHINWLPTRQAAVHMLRGGCMPTEVARRMERCVSWVCKWRDRYEEEGWSGLEDRSRAPRNPRRVYLEPVRRAICQARSELEAEAHMDSGLGYIGSPAVRARLQEKQARGGYDGSIPSIATIERVLRTAEMVGQRQKAEPEVHYPHLQPTAPQQLIQVDIVPHYLTGGQAVACFNAIDVVSRKPSGQAQARRRSREACEFLFHTWQTLGIPRYTQVDNEGCFSGGFTHRGVLGKVLRLALYVGTELVFSPFYHPASNGTVERFHQDYDAHVWERIHLEGLADVQKQAVTFFNDYQHSRHHSALKGQSPAEVHAQVQPSPLAADFTYSEKKLPLTEGQVHFMRRVSDGGTVKVLNMEWQVPQPENTPAVWVTLEFAVTGATLRIYDAAPDAEQRTCLAAYDFPLNEPVLPRQTSTSTASVTHIADNPKPADQPSTASAADAAAISPSPSTDDAPASEEAMPTSLTQAPTAVAQSLIGPLVQPSQPLNLPAAALLLGLVCCAARLTRRARFTMF